LNFSRHLNGLNIYMYREVENLFTSCFELNLQELTHNRLCIDKYVS